ncbi:oligosaccharide flippase family protein [Solibacillus sp. FSL R5-0449]|uniref:oligosaccharide flippase family protein n=1 Tax=Solibacillus sp. FSL R5-0449 TaxID=2921639 RepID=UPI0030CFEEE8
MYKKLWVLFSGTMLAQIIPLFTLPIITRLFGPEEIGIYSLYLTVVSIGVIFTTMRFEMAIPLVSHKKIKQVLKNIIYINFIAAILFAFFLTIFLNNINLFSHYNPYSIGILAFISVNSVGIYQVFYQYGIKNTEFKVVSTNKVTNQINIAIFSLIIGYFLNSYLIWAVVIAQILCIITLKFRLKLDFVDTVFSFKQLKETIIEYRKFPLLQLPIQLLSTLSSNSILLATSFLFTSQELGFYSLTERILRSPISILGSGSADLFKNMATKEMEYKGNCAKSYKKILVFNFITGIPIFVVLYFIIDLVIYYFFGEIWMESARYSKILIPSLFAMYIVYPVNYLFILYDYQNIEFYIQAVQLLAIVLAVLWIFNKNLNITDLLIIYAVISTLISIVTGVLGFLIIKLSRR